MPFGLAVSAEPPHLTFAAASSDAEVAPGKRFSIVLDVEPRPRIHVYAPGTHTDQVLALALDTEPWLKVQPPRARASITSSLDERLEVYMKPFRLVRGTCARKTRSCALLA